MRCEIPAPNRCCCCLPLRPGLIVWAYFNVIINITLLVYVFGVIALKNRADKTLAFDVYNGVILVTIFTDIIFHTVFLVGAHRKEYRKIRVFYRYSIAVLVMNIIGILLQVGLYIYLVVYSVFVIIMAWYFMGFLLGMSIVTAVIHVYLIFLLRSEILKLKNNSQFQFVNTCAEPECTLQVGVAKEKIDI